MGERETAGLRVDDLLLLLFFLVYIWGRLALKPSHVPLHTHFCRIECCLFVFIAFALLSIALNRLFALIDRQDLHAHIFYALRIAEYFLFFYVGVIACQVWNLSSIVWAFFIWNALLMLFQKAGWIGQFTIQGYLPINTDRVTGIASFPSEAGMLLNMLFAYLIYLPKKQLSGRWLPAHVASFFQQTRIYWLFLLFAMLVTLTGSRAALAVLFLMLLFRLKWGSKWTSGDWIYASVFLLAAALIMVFMIGNTAALFERSAYLLSLDNVDLLKLVWDQVGADLNMIEAQPTMQQSYDMSWWIRIHKWTYAFKVYLMHPECYLQGVGPGFCAAALDGGHLRLLVENGCAGVLLFWLLMAQIYRQNQQLKWMVLALLINMLFFDVYLAYKPMSLLFLISGYSWGEQQQEQKKSISY